MIYWITHDGRTFVAQDEKELVDCYRGDTITPTKDAQDFMEQMCIWTRLYCKAELDPTTPTTFVQSLLDTGLLTKRSMS